MNIGLPFLFLAFLLVAGCSDDADMDVVTPASPPTQEDKPNPKVKDLVREEARFLSNDRDLDEIMEDFSGSIDTSPTVDQVETVMKKNGRLYRRGIEDEPFSGTVVESFPDGSLSLSTTFYQGKPHGFQKRTFPGGGMASEIFFDKGVLSGTKTSPGRLAGSERAAIQ